MRVDYNIFLLTLHGYSFCMRPWKNILIAILIFITSAGLLIVLTVVIPEDGDKICEDIEFVVSDYNEYRFINATNVETHLKNSGLYPVGKCRADISLADIEHKVEEMLMVKDAVCYFESDGNLCISVTQRIPLFRVKTVNNDYYVDTDRRKMPVSVRFTAYVPVVTGVVDEEFAKGGLYDFIEYISGNSRWASAFTQIYVYPDKRVELLPRVGDFVVKMGTLDRYERKLYKLDIFLKKVPRYVSWDKYSALNLEYVDQVVCTKRK